MSERPSNPPRNGEGDRSPQANGGGGPPRRKAAPAVLRAPIKQVKRARKLRREMSLAEVLLWQQFQTRPGGFKFRRQYPGPEANIDFSCLSTRLCIEVDGEAHDRGNAPAYDAARDERLNREGFDVLRIPAVEVLRNLDGVIAMIVARCEAGPLHHPSDGPPPRAGEDLE